jgi:hypothetical protein
MMELEMEREVMYHVATSALNTLGRLRKRRGF